MSDSECNIRQRKANVEEEVLGGDANSDNGFDVTELANSLRKSHVRRATLIGDRLASYDKDGDGRISIGEFSAVVQDLVSHENQNNLMRKMLVGATISVVVLMVSTFGLSFATATLAKEVSEDNGALISSKTGEKLSTIAQGGGGVNVPLTLVSAEAERRLETDGGDPGRIFEGTVPQSSVLEAYNQATGSNSAVRTSWTDSDGVAHSILINVNSLTSTPVNGSGSIYTDIIVSHDDDDTIPLDVQVTCHDINDLTCDVHSTFNLPETEESSSSRNLKSLESFPRELFGVAEDQIPGGSCGLDGDEQVKLMHMKMKAEALVVKNRASLSKILKDATPISSGPARQFLAAFQKTSEDYDSESSEYDLASNNCLHFAVSYLKALGKKMQPHHVFYMARRLADNIPGLVDKLLKNPSVIEHGGLDQVKGGNDADVLVSLSWILETKEKKKMGLRNTR